MDDCYCVEDGVLLGAGLYWGNEELLLLEAFAEELAGEEFGGLEVGEVGGEVEVEPAEVLADLVDVLELSKEALWAFALGGEEQPPIILLRIYCYAIELIIFQEINFFRLCQ